MKVQSPEIRLGKWMLFNSMEETDRLWPLLKDALRQRLLGGVHEVRHQQRPRWSSYLHFHEGLAKCGRCAACTRRPTKDYRRCTFCRNEVLLV